MGSFGIAKATAALIFFLFSISIHAWLSKRTKQAGPTVKHASWILSKQTRKQARQTVTKWQFTLFPSKSLSCYDDCSISPSKQAIRNLTNFCDDCSISPSRQTFKSLDDCSISPSKQAFNSLDDCSSTPFIISQFQTETFVDLPLQSTATEAINPTEDDPTAPSSITIALDDNPTSPSLPPTATVAGPPRRLTSNTVATVASPPRRPTSSASVDLPLHSTVPLSGPPLRPSSTVSLFRLILLSSIMSGLQTPMSLAAQAAADTQAAAQAAAATQAAAAAQAAAGTISAADFMKFLQA
jgi:hypothetical protein